MRSRDHLTAKPHRLWRCPRCGRRFANVNQSHACARYSLREHLVGKPPEIVALYRRFAAMVRANGPVLVVPEKTRIAFQVRMSFAVVTVHRRWLDGHVVLARRFSHPRFRRIQTISPHNHVHTFRVTSESELDEVVAGWLREAYAVGKQLHLGRG